MFTPTVMYTALGFLIVSTVVCTVIGWRRGEGTCGMLMGLVGGMMGPIGAVISIICVAVLIQKD
jgi:hypothetical protein